MTLTLGHEQLHSDDLSYSYEPRSKSNHLSVSLINRGCVVVVLLFYVHGKHLRSCQEGQLT